MVRGTPETREARQAFAAALNRYRGAERDGQKRLHTLRQELGRPLRRSDVPDEMVETMAQFTYAAQRAGGAVLRNPDRVDDILLRASQLEKRRIDREA